MTRPQLTRLMAKPFLRPADPRGAQQGRPPDVVDDVTRPRLALACALAAALACAAPVSAQGYERINATFLAEYGSESYTIDQGEIVTFANQDKFLTHGIVSDAGSGSLFSAPVIGRGQVRLLRGAPFLTSAGSPYSFHCPIHPGMTSVLNVTGAGTPLAADGTAPGARVKLKTGSVRRLAGKHKLRVVLTPSEPVDAVVKATAEGNVLGRVERTYVSAGRKAVALKLSAAAAGAVLKAAAAGPVKLRVKVTLSDLAGNSGRVRARRVLAGVPSKRKGEGGKNG